MNVSKEPLAAARLPLDVVVAIWLPLLPRWPKQLRTELPEGTILT